MLVRLLAIVDPHRSKTIATALLNEFGSLALLSAQSPEAIRRVAGNRPGIVSLLSSAHELMIETLRSRLDTVRIDPFAPALREYLIASMGSLPTERLRVLFLDSARRLLADEEVQQGTLAQIAIYPRTIFRRALEHNAAAIILVHNHPSGDVLPSEADIIATRKLEQVGRSLEVHVLDHIVVTATHVHHVMSEAVIADRCAGPVSCTLRTGPSRSDERALHNAQQVVRRRILRRQLLGSSELFGEPAWDMMLDLFIHQMKGSTIAMSSLCMVTDLPTSSAMKLIHRLCDAGLMERKPDHRDGRRSLIELGPEIAHRMRAYFAEGTE